MPRGLRVLQAPPYVTRLLSEAGVVKEMVAVLAGPGPAPARRSAGTPRRVKKTLTSLDQPDRASGQDQQDVEREAHLEHDQ